MINCVLTSVSSVADDWQNTTDNNIKRPNIFQAFNLSTCWRSKKKKNKWIWMKNRVEDWLDLNMYFVYFPRCCTFHLNLVLLSFGSGNYKSHNNYPISNLKFPEYAQFKPFLYWSRSNKHVISAANKTTVKIENGNLTDLCHFVSLVQLNSCRKKKLSDYNK